MSVKANERQTQRKGEAKVERLWCYQRMRRGVVVVPDVTSK